MLESFRAALKEITKQWIGNEATNQMIQQSHGQAGAATTQSQSQSSAQNDNGGANSNSASASSVSRSDSW
jgi:hypothetical protein